MDIQRVSGNPVDYDEFMESKKALPCTEDRLDSGLDSLKEDEYNNIVTELTNLKVENCALLRTECSNEPWKQQRTDDGDTFLHIAIIHEAVPYAVEIIRASRYDPFLNVQNYQRQTALHLAVITEQPQLVEALVNAGCDPELVDDCGNTALHIACKKGSLHCFSVLTQLCQRQLPTILAAYNYSGQTCLHLAANNGFLSLVENLIDLGANINAQEQCNGRTALHLAVDLQNLQLVEILVNKGINVNGLTYGGYSAYHLTHGRPNVEIQRKLYGLTAEELRELPESDCDESEEELMSEDEEMYDDIFLAGHK